MIVTNVCTDFCKFAIFPQRYRQYLAPSLHQVVKALDDIEDKDYEWRAQLMMLVHLFLKNLVFKLINVFFLKFHFQ